MTSDFLGHLSSTATKTVALLFLPFTTKMVYYECVASLVGEVFGDQRQPDLQIPVANRPTLDRLDIYVGDPSGIRLSNLWRFLDFNEITTVNSRLNYTMALVVGVNVVHDVYVDIPISAFPWPSGFYSVQQDHRFFLTAPEDGLVNPHAMASICQTCKAAKKRCVRTGLVCNSCIFSNIECLPGVDEAQKRRNQVGLLARRNVDTLCPIYQYTINIFLRLHSDTLHPAHTVASLGNFLLSTTQPSRNVHAEHSLEFYADSLQHVVIMSGNIHVLKEERMEDIWGFEVAGGLQNRRYRSSLITPHLGMHSPVDAYSLIDAALGTPGEIFYRDMCILTRSFEARSARIMAVGIVLSPVHVEILLGWKFPY